MLPTPPLATLRAFDAAARHLNFRLAAEELNVTHGAVAQQVRALEASLGA
ncbi:LysR family transcriptional regulator, partial [Enterobacter hormaechei]